MAHREGMFTLRRVLHVAPGCRWTMASIAVHDGAENIGGNKIYVEDNERGVFLDFGRN